MRDLVFALAAVAFLLPVNLYGSQKWNVLAAKDGSLTLMAGSDTVVSGATAAYKLADRTVSSEEYSRFKTKTGRLATELGQAETVEILYRDKDLPDFRLTWHLYDDFVTVCGTVESKSEVEVGGIMPLVAQNQTISFGDDTRALFVPFDNDAWIRYSSKALGFGELTSYEVSSIFGNASRTGYVFGSIEHDRWKSAVIMNSEGESVTGLKLLAGVADALTRDVLPHGSFKAEEISSPRFFIGRYSDWRAGMEAFGEANAAVNPPRSWEHAMPIGWNSWGALAFNINYKNATEVADFIHDHLQANSFETADGTLYIGLDSGWSFLSEAQLADFVKRCHAHGQKAGIYWTPFTDWGKRPDAKMEYAEEYVFSDAWLYADGKPQELDGAYALDPTHPAVVKRIKAYSDLFRRLGFSYVKLDFMTHGAMEADGWYDESIESGIQAYNAGMDLIDKCFEGIYINLSISPAFPAHYANSRRIACDAWNWMKDTEYTLNATSYGWWLDRVYNYNDADHIVLKEASAGENRARVTSGVITGIYIFGDDVSADGSQDVKERAIRYLTNPKVNAAATGESFRPVEGNGEMSENQFVSSEREGKRYYAVFNYSDSQGSFPVSLDRLGLEDGETYVFEELWSEKEFTADSDFVLDIPAKDVMFFSIIKK